MRGKGGSVVSLSSFLVLLEISGAKSGGSTHRDRLLKSVVVGDEESDVGDDPGNEHTEQANEEGTERSASIFPSSTSFRCV